MKGMSLVSLRGSFSISSILFGHGPFYHRARKHNKVGFTDHEVGQGTAASAKPSDLNALGDVWINCLP